MKKIACLLGAFTLGLLALAPDVDARIAPLRVCFISGSAEYESDKTMPILKKYLEAKYPTVVTMISAKGDDLPGLENLDRCDVAVFFTRRLKLNVEQTERIKKYCAAGKNLVGIRTASHGVQTWLEFDQEVIGGNYKGHYAEGPVTEIKFTEAEKSHSILKDFVPFKSKGSLYKNTGLAKDVNVLLTGSIPDHTEPIAWTRMNKEGRVFYTSLGHQKDFEEENFLKLMTNAILWSGNRVLRTK